MAKDSTAKKAEVESKAEAKIFEALSKDFGSLLFKADEQGKFNTEGIPLPSIAMGVAAGSFDLPFGKMAMLYGAYGSGKSMACYLSIAKTQKKFPKSFCAIVNAEGSLNKKWLKQLGVDLSRLIVIDSTDGVEIFSALCGVYNDKTGKKTKLGILDHAIAGTLDLKLIVLDSWATIQPPQEAGRSFESQEIAALPKFVNRALRFCRPMLAKANVAMMTVNHLRMKMDGSGGTYFVGGSTLAHQMDFIFKLHASTKAEAQILDENGKKQGHMIICTVEKTRFGANRHQAEFFLDFRKGVVRTGMELAEVAAAFGVVDHSSPQSAWVYGEESVRGKEKFGEFLEENPVIFDEIFEKVKKCQEQGVEAQVQLSDEAALFLDKDGLEE